MANKLLGLKEPVKLLSCVWLCDPMPTRLLRPWNFPGKSAGVGCHFLLQGIFPTQSQTQVSRITSRRFTVWAIGEAPGLKESDHKGPVNIQWGQQSWDFCAPVALSLSVCLYPTGSWREISQLRLVQKTIDESHCSVLGKYLLHSCFCVSFQLRTLLPQQWYYLAMFPD